MALAFSVLRLVTTSQVFVGGIRRREIGAWIASFSALPLLVCSQKLHILYKSLYCPIIIYKIMIESQRERFLYGRLIDPKEHVGLKEEAIHELCALNTEQAVKALISAYPFLSGSELLSHEALFALGQFSEDKAPFLKDFVISVVNDEKDNNLSRH